MPTKGRTLKVQRIRAGVKVQALAERWGRHRNTITLIEKLAEVPPADVQGYLEALASFTERSEPAA